MIQHGTGSGRVAVCKGPRFAFPSEVLLGASWFPAADRRPGRPAGACTVSGWVVCPLLPIAIWSAVTPGCGPSGLGDPGRSGGRTDAAAMGRHARSSL